MIVVRDKDIFYFPVHLYSTSHKATVIITYFNMTQQYDMVMNPYTVVSVVSGEGKPARYHCYQ